MLLTAGWAPPAAKTDLGRVLFVYDVQVQILFHMHVLHALHRICWSLQLRNLVSLAILSIEAVLATVGLHVGPRT